MRKRKQKIRVGLSTEAKINQEFVRAWKQAEKGRSSRPVEHVYFLDAGTMLRVLSDRRLSLLTILRHTGSTSIRALSHKLHRNYRNVYDDVQLLIRAGLLQQVPDKKVSVPWDKIQAEIDLAA